MLEYGQKFIGGVVFGIGRLFLVLMVAAFILIDLDRIQGFLRSLVPERYQGDYDRIYVGIDRGLSGVIRGQLLICLINGIFTYIGLLVFHVKYPLLLAGIAATMSLIPIFGSILSSVPIVAVALISSGNFDLRKGVFVLAWIIGIHLVEANFLNPKIMGERGQDSPGAGGVRADRRRAQLRPGRRAVRGARSRRSSRRSSSTTAGARSGARPPADAAAVGSTRRLTAARAPLQSDEMIGLPVGADDQRGAIGDVVPAGARRDVAVRLDDHGAQRLVRNPAAAALRIAAIVGGVADGAVGDPLDVEVAHRVRAAGRDEAAAVGRDQRDLQRRRADRTSSRSTKARLLRSATCTAVGGGVG